MQTRTRYPVTCAHCQRAFLTTRREQKYCNTGCSDQHQAERRRASAQQAARVRWSQPRVVEPDRITRQLARIEAQRKAMPRRLFVDPWFWRGGGGAVAMGRY